MPLPKFAAALPGRLQINTLDPTPTSSSALESRRKRRRRRHLAPAAFHLAHRLALHVYEQSAHISPTDSLAVQLRKAATDLAATIAVASSPGGASARNRALNTARTLARHLSYQLLLAHDLGHISAIQYHHLRNDYLRVARLLARILGRA